MAPGGNYGKDCAVFEAIHGSAPDIAGQGIANPIAMLLSGAMMCHHLGHPAMYSLIRRSTADVTREDKSALTPDLGGTGTTASLADAIIEKVKIRRAKGE